MNIRQKYKKAKKELEFYRKRKIGDYVVFKTETPEIQVLVSETIVPFYGENSSVDYERLVCDQLLSSIKPFINVRHYDFVGEHRIRATIRVINETDNMRANYMGLPVAERIDEEPLFIKEQLWPKENPYLK